LEELFGDILDDPLRNEAEKAVYDDNYDDNEDISDRNLIEDGISEEDFDFKPRQSCHFALSPYSFLLRDAIDVDFCLEMCSDMDRCETVQVENDLCK